MEIIAHNYENILKEMIINNFKDIINKKEHRYDNKNKVFNYIDILSNMDEALCELAKDTIKAVFNAIDKGFRLSLERRAKYHIKAYHERTIMTIFGEVTYERTFYTDKSNNGSYCYLDNYLGLKQYDYFDPYIKALIIEKAADNSAPKVAEFINDLIGKRVKITKSFEYLSRQTIRNIILESNMSNIKPQEQPAPETLYIMADEKFISTQNNDKKQVMVKSIVTFEGIERKNKRRSLKNKNIFATFGKKGPAEDVLDYLNEIYDLDKIKNIFFMGDGASWIRNISREFKFTKDTNLVFALDKFHFKQAMHHLCMHEELEKIMIHYVRNDMKDDFKHVCEILIENNPHREKTIEAKRTYILNNWNNINNLYKNNLSCPMESQISHNLAALFTSRPKGYSIKTLKKLIPLRMLFKNNNNLKELYLNNYNKKEIITINEEQLNYSIFEKKSLNINPLQYIDERTFKKIYDN